MAHQTLTFSGLHRQQKATGSVKHYSRNCTRMTSRRAIKSDANDWGLVNLVFSSADWFACGFECTVSTQSWLEGTAAISQSKKRQLRIVGKKYVWNHPLTAQGEIKSEHIYMVKSWRDRSAATEHAHIFCDASQWPFLQLREVKFWVWIGVDVNKPRFNK